MTEQWAEEMDQLYCDLAPHLDGRSFQDVICMAIYLLAKSIEQKPELTGYVKGMLNHLDELYVGETRH